MHKDLLARTYLKLYGEHIITDGADNKASGLRSLKTSAAGK